MAVVVLVDEVDAWFIELARQDQATSEVVAAAIDLLEDGGPTLGRPLVDRIKGSKNHNMKELRPSGTSIRILFVFDPHRDAILLVAGDKAGDWRRWYTTHIPIADRRYDRWLAGGYA